MVKYHKLILGEGLKLPFREHGGACWKFWKELLRGTKFLFCGRGLKILSTLRGTKCKTKHYLLSYFFFAQ